MRFNLGLAYAMVNLVALRATAATQQSNTLRVMSYNVRYDSKPDNITVKETLASLSDEIPDEPSKYYNDTSEQPWSIRRIRVASDILSRDVDVYGGQELLERQVLDLDELLGDRFGWIGVGRNDGRRKGEFAAIFYNKHTVRLIKWDTFWLTDTPFDVSKYPGAGSYRSATTAHFLSAQGPFTIINTHLDDQSAQQRQVGASLVLHRAKYEAIKKKHPVFITGDFNSPSDDGAYQIMTGKMYPVPINKTFTEKYSWENDQEPGFHDFTCKDLLGETPPWRRSGNYATFTGFTAVGSCRKFKRLDYIFAGSNPGWTVESYRVGSNRGDDGIYASDHRPVIADLKIGKDIYLTTQP